MRASSEKWFMTHGSEPMDEKPYVTMTPKDTVWVVHWSKLMRAYGWDPLKNNNIKTKKCHLPGLIKYETAIEISRGIPSACLSVFHSYTMRISFLWYLYMWNPLQSSLEMSSSGLGRFSSQAFSRWVQNLKFYVIVCIWVCALVI